MLWLELLSLSAITLLCVIAQIHNGFKFDVSQLRLEGISGTGACTGLVMAIFGFVGFESAATLGAEADDPKNKIPQALMTSVLGCGVFFVFTTFIIVSTFKGIKGVQLASCATPLLVMSDYLGVTWLGKFTNFGAAVSFFACTLAATNAAGRIMLTMAHDGLFPRSLATVCAVRRTPAKAILVAVIIGILPAVALVSFGLPTLDIVGWLGTLATYGYLVAYFLISVTSCFYLKGLGQLRKPMILVATLSALCTMAAFVGTFYPVPQGVYKWLPYLCCTYVLIGLFFCYFRSKNLAEPVSAALIEQ